MTLLAPFPFFGGKRAIADIIWARLGTVKQYVEPFCGSAAVLLAAPSPASLEVVNDINGFIVNFWRCVKCQPRAVAEAADYPVSHVDLGARHRWLLGQVGRLGAELQDPHWPGDPLVAGWWLWGQCAWIGSGWCECEWSEVRPSMSGVEGKGQIPHLGNAGMGVQATGKIPHISDGGRGIHAIGQVPAEGFRELDTTGGETALAWLTKLSRRLNRVRLVHGHWDRCLNTTYGEGSGGVVAMFLDPPYKEHEELYGQTGARPVASEVEDWVRENGRRLRIALAGHLGDYELPDWETVAWERPGLTYGSGKTKAREALWFSPSCLKGSKQLSLLEGLAS